MVVPLGLGARALVAEHALRSRLGAAGSETSNSETCGPWRMPCVGRVLADAEQQAVADRVQVGASSRRPSARRPPRVPGVGEVERESGSTWRKVTR